MSKLLTISGSYRSRGNGEFLLDICNKFLPNEEQTRLYLQDYKIENCTGCMACAINKHSCKIEDDIKDLIDKVLNCDTLIISSPVYFLGAASIIKAINDRLLIMHNLVDYSKRKPAGIIITAGREGWEGHSIQDVSILLLSLGFYVKDVLLVHGQGPSEVVLIPDIEEKVKTFTSNIIDPDYKVPHISNKCPVCFGESFKILETNKVKCQICNITGKVTTQQDSKILIEFPENSMQVSRWSNENLKDHMENWVGGSIEIYRKKTREIILKRKILSNLS